jgi:GNAT superfamily N-acetyltransferase
MNIRILDDSDRSRLEAFLKEHRDTSMFLRSNALRVGLVYRQEPLHAFYAAVIANERVCGVIAHGWNGMLILQCPNHTEELARACVQRSGRRVTGLIGPLDQVQRARRALNLDNAPARMEEDEWLYGLDLSELIVPDPLRNGSILCRPPLPEEHDELGRWRFAYDIEVLGGTASEETRQRAAAFLDRQIEERNVWVALKNERLVSLSAFNATLTDIVQLGGIYTPPEFRGRGYAKVSVAASLIVARERGASRAVLFTSNPSAARSYEGIGFRRLGDYGLIMLE